MTATPSGRSRPSRRRATSLPKPSSRCHALPMPAISTCLGRLVTSGSLSSSGASGAGGLHVSRGGSSVSLSRCSSSLIAGTYFRIEGRGGPSGGPWSRDHLDLFGEEEQEATALAEDLLHRVVV